MTDLTEQQKFDAKKVFDELVNFMWNKVMERMIAYGENYEQALGKVLEEIMND